MLKYFFFRVSQFLVRALPLSLSYQISYLLSDTVYFFNKKDRNFIERNLSIICKQQNNYKFLAREVFRNFGRYLVDFMRMDKYLTLEYIQNNVEIQNIDRIQGALKKGKGGIILTAHLGSWELGCGILSLLGYPVTAVALEHKEKKVNAFFVKQRESKGIEVLPTNIALRQCVTVLRQNKLVGMVADQTFGSKGEIMNFFGQKTEIPKGPAAFACKTNAAIIPTFLIRKANNQFILSVEEPLFADENLDGEERILSLMQRYTSMLESKIYQYPEQWIMFKEFAV